MSHTLLFDGDTVASGDQNMPETAGKTTILIMLCVYNRHEQSGTEGMYLQEFEESAYYMSADTIW